MYFKPPFLFLVLLFALTSMSCEHKKASNNKVHNEVHNEVIDSINYYLNEANTEYSIDKRKDFALKAYALTPKLDDSLKAVN